MARRKIDKQALASLIRKLKELNNDQKADLLQLLNEQKRYGLVWEEHKEEAEELLTENIPVLVEETPLRLPRGGESSPNHILIEGDNLHALTALTYTHEGKVDVIYIDPPYNTGNRDFVYNDSFVDSEDGYRHSKWLSFMEKRLRIAKKLLSLLPERPISAHHASATAERWCAEGSVWSEWWTATGTETGYCWTAER